MAVLRSYLSRKFYRILLKICSQFSVQFGMIRAQRTRLLKKCFYRDGEEFGRISRSVRVEQCGNAALVGGA